MEENRDFNMQKNYCKIITKINELTDLISKSMSFSFADSYNALKEENDKCFTLIKNSINKENTQSKETKRRTRHRLLTPPIYFKTKEKEESIGMQTFVNFFSGIIKEKTLNSLTMNDSFREFCCPVVDKARGIYEHRLVYPSRVFFWLNSHGSYKYRARLSRFARTDQGKNYVC
jgi:hypothetical protein